MLKRICTVLAAGAAICGLAATASHAGPKTSFVRAHVIELLEGALTQQQIKKLQVLAHQSAIAQVCEGFTIDEVKFSEAFAELGPVDPGKMSDNQKDYHDKHILVLFGMLVGGEVNSMGDDASTACADAAKERAETEMLSDLVWK